MSRFTLPRDVYHGMGCLEELKNLKGKKAILVVGGGSMRRQGFLDKAVDYLKDAGMEVELFEGVEPDPSVETVMKGAEAMRKFQPDWKMCIRDRDMEERSLFHRMRQIFREEGETEEVGSQAMKLIRNIVRYLDKDAKDIMTHRRDIVGIDEEETLETALKFMLGERFSRFPVYREDIDEIIGTIHLRDAMT